MRGFKAEHTAQTFADGYRVYHNFIKQHQGIKKIPSELAIPDLKLGRNKWLDLLKQSLKENSA